jgi:peroxisomal 3,2-trans-enoyl-CoA isomerase
MFVKRMGLATANEALITSRRIPVSQLHACGFVNEVFPTEGFFNNVRAHIRDVFGSHLNHDSMIRIKALIKSSYMRELEATNVSEHYGGLARFAAGIPQKEFVRFLSQLIYAF